MKLARGVVSVENIQDIDRATAQTFRQIFSLDYKKVGEREATVTYRSGMVVRPILCVGIVVPSSQSLLKA